MSGLKHKSCSIDVKIVVTLFFPLNGNYLCQILPVEYGIYQNVSQGSALPSQDC